MADERGISQNWILYDTANYSFDEFQLKAVRLSASHWTHNFELRLSSRSDTPNKTTEFVSSLLCNS